jgi:hypothetical protein
MPIFWQGFSVGVVSTILTILVIAILWVITWGA